MLVFPLARDSGNGARQGRAPADATRMAACSTSRPFAIETGLSWQDSADRTFTRSREELAEWFGARASAGRMVPKGFPRTGKFG